MISGCAATAMRQSRALPLDKYWELNGIDMLRYLLLLMRVALQVCEPHTALDFPEKNDKKYQKVKPYTQIYMFKLQFSARKFSEDPQNK